MPTAATGTDRTFYRAQYEILNQDLTLSALADEARYRLRTEIAQLGLATIGEISEPLTFEAAGTEWIQIEVEIRDAAKLLGAAS